MGKKILYTLLAMALLISSFSVLAKENSEGSAAQNSASSNAEKSSGGGAKASVTSVTGVSESSDAKVNEDSTEPEDSDVDEDTTTEPEATADDTSDTTSDTTGDVKTDNKTTPPAADTTADKSADNGKSKVIKDLLKEKIQARAEAKLAAKELISDLKDMFKDADTDTKKEILKNIADVKKELKDSSIGTFVKGLVVDFEKYDGVKPIIENGRTLVPVRAIVESLGADVNWNEETKTITISKGDITIEMQLDNKTAKVNGQDVEMEVAPTTKNDRTIVPIRFIAETLKLSVDWDEDSQTIVID